MRFRERQIIEELNAEELDQARKHFTAALIQIFSPEYLKKIKKTLKKDIHIKQKDFKDPSKAAYTEGRTIYINEPIFDRLSQTERVNFILHEFIHVMQNTKNFFIMRTFKEVYNVGNELYKSIKKNLDGDLGEFLTGRKQKITSPKYEVISYLMNNSLNWQMLYPEGKKEIINIIIRSGIFNTSSKFWQERLF